MMYSYFDCFDFVVYLVIEGIEVADERARDEGACRSLEA